MSVFISVDNDSHKVFLLCLKMLCKHDEDATSDAFCNAVRKYIKYKKIVGDQNLNAFCIMNVMPRNNECALCYDKNSTHYFVGFNEFYKFIQNIMTLLFLS